MAMKRRVLGRAWEKRDAREIVAEEIRFPDADRSAKDVDMIEDFAGLNPPLDILDVGCGVGRHAIEFAERGDRAVAIDIDKRVPRSGGTSRAGCERGGGVSLAIGSRVDRKGSFRFRLGALACDRLHEERGDQVGERIQGFREESGNAQGVLDLRLPQVSPDF